MTRRKKTPRVPKPTQRIRTDDIDESRLNDPDRLDIAEVFAQEHNEPRSRIGDSSPLVENQWYEALEHNVAEPDREDRDDEDLLAELAKTKPQPESL